MSFNSTSTYNNTPIYRVIDDIIYWNIDLEYNNWMIQEIITFRFQDTDWNIRKKISASSNEAKNICNLFFNDC